MNFSVYLATLQKVT